MKRNIWYQMILAGIFLIFILGPAFASERRGDHFLFSIEISNQKNLARCLLKTDGPAELSSGVISGPERIYVDLKRLTLKKGALVGLKNAGLIRRVWAAQFSPHMVRVVFEFRRKPNLVISRLSGTAGFKLVFSRKAVSSAVKDGSFLYSGKTGISKTGRPSAGSVESRMKEPLKKHLRKTALLLSRAHQIQKIRAEILGSEKALKRPGKGGSDGRTSGLTTRKHPADAASSSVRRHDRKVPQWRVVIDPGHGGKDPGTSGADGHHEKRYTLEIARRLAAILRRKPGYKVYLTRDDDKFISLDQRTLIANRLHADIFVSIHINWSPDSQTRGITTYFLNWTNDEEANRVAARENQISLRRQKVARTRLGYILASLKLESKRDKSLKLANYIEDSIEKKVRPHYPGEKDLGVKQALFYVLVGDRMPAVLTEVSFLSNRRDEKLLQKHSYINDVAKGMAAGIEDYFRRAPAQNLQALRNGKGAEGNVM